MGRVRMRLTRGVCHVGALADDIITPLLGLTLRSLSECGVVGTTHLHLNVRITATAPGWEPTLDWEHDEARWCSCDEAEALLYWPEPREVLRELR